MTESLDSCAWRASSASLGLCAFSFRFRLGIVLPGRAASLMTLLNGYHDVPGPCVSDFIILDLGVVLDGVMLTIYNIRWRLPDPPMLTPSRGSQRRCLFDCLLNGLLLDALTQLQKL